jgi:hypothetical protein
VKDLKGGKTVGGRTRVGLPTRVGLAGVQARALSEVGSGSRIRYDPGRVRQVKVKSLSRGSRVSWVRLARLSELRQKSYLGSGQVRSGRVRVLG